jgi:endonuclease G
MVREQIADNPGLATRSDEVTESDGAEFYRDCVCVLSGNQVAQGSTGTLIGPNVVLTCGHTFNKDKNPNGGLDRVFVGCNVQKQNPVGSDCEFISVKKVVLHDGYNVTKHPPQTDPQNPLAWTDLENDLALLILERDAKFARPRALATTEQINAAFAIRVVGFGVSELQDGLPVAKTFGIKRQVLVPIATLACDSNQPNYCRLYGCLKGKELVASDLQKGADSCKGDSGGPAYIEMAGAADKKPLLAAVVSRSIRATEHTKEICGAGGIYVRVDKYKPWIVKTAKDNGGILP